MKLNVGIIGLGGSWETRYAPALWSLEDWFHIAAISDPIAARAEQLLCGLAARGPAPDRVDGFRSLIAREDIDAILVLSHRWFGELPILAACEMGKAIYCADIFDRSCLRNSAWRRHLLPKAESLFFPELPLRYIPATLRLKELMATSLGRPSRLRCILRNRVDSLATHPDPEMAIQSLLHHVDWCRNIVGYEPSSVVGLAHQLESPDAGDDPPDDRLMMDLDFSVAARPGTGTMAWLRWEGSVPASWLETENSLEPIDCEVTCDRGSVQISFPDKLVWMDAHGANSEYLDRDWSVGEQMFLQFHRILTNPGLDTNSLKDCCRAIAIVQMAARSQKEGRRIWFEEEFCE
ncbi:MAG: Gfo/Idh/MocA family oxidoreductase [Pirellulales bacterium]|nr:Gfo/Idh/MocA family oxidoreductase [Pirellulales bacterium]